MADCTSHRTWSNFGEQNTSICVSIDRVSKRTLFITKTASFPPPNNVIPMAPYISLDVFQCFFSIQIYVRLIWCASYEERNSRKQTWQRFCMLILKKIFYVQSTLLVRYDRRFVTLHNYHPPCLPDLTKTFVSIMKRYYCLSSTDWKWPSWFGIGHREGAR